MKTSITSGRIHNGGMYDCRARVGLKNRDVICRFERVRIVNCGSTENCYWMELNLNGICGLHMDVCNGSTVHLFCLCIIWYLVSHF